MFAVEHAPTRTDTHGECRRVKLGHLCPSESGHLASWHAEMGLSAQSELGRREVVGVEQWAPIRWLHLVNGLSQREIRKGCIAARCAGRLTAASRRSVDARRPTPSSGWTASKRIVDDYPREVRPLFAHAASSFAQPSNGRRLHATAATPSLAHVSTGATGPHFDGP
jgi:hypothetical protein